MPLWLIYHTSDTFTSASSKQALAQDITGYYMSKGLPDFYVIVNFVPLTPENVYKGGQKAHKFVRIAVDHIAVRLQNLDREYKRVSDGLTAVLKPHLEGRGWDWEFHVDETERRMWRINGLEPPPFRSEQEKMWFDEGKPGPWQ